MACSLIKLASFWLFVFLFAAGTASARNERCPFDLLYHLGDGVFDSGNAIARMSRLPAATLPYGRTNPGSATGRWSDGMLDIDYGAEALGFDQGITHHLQARRNNASSSNAIMFAVARSPVLDHSFFRARRVRVPSYAAPLSLQMRWFKSICSNQKDCADKLRNALVLFGDVEANDMTIPLIQGKPIREVKTYIPYVTKAQINAAREVIRMGATRVIIPGNAPLGCYPSILTEFPSSDPSAYDDLGCLKSVNNLIVAKNNDLQEAITSLQKEFPNTFILYADFYNSMMSLFRETASSDPSRNLALRACCGAGGKYNYNKKRFCGSPGVPVCSNPRQYIHWDGIHLTDEANYRLSSALQAATLDSLNCTSTPFVSKLRRT